MAYNPYFPTGYSYPMYQQPIQPQQPQNFTRPTIHAEIVQIDGDREEAQNFPVQTGGTQMMINKAETKIFIKTVYANGQCNVDEFVKQAPAPKTPAINYDDFVTREELEKRLSELTKKEGDKNGEQKHIQKAWKSDKQSGHTANTANTGADAGDV